MLKIVIADMDKITIEAEDRVDLNDISYNLGTPAGKNPYNIRFNKNSQKWFMDIPKDDLEKILFRFSCID